MKTVEHRMTPVQYNVVQCGANEAKNIAFYNG